MVNESSLLTAEQVLLLENLTYLEDKPPFVSLENQIGDGQEITVEKFLKKIKIEEIDLNKDYGSYMTGGDWKNIIRAIEADETLMNMKIVDVAGEPSEGEESSSTGTGSKEEKQGALSAVFVNEETKEAVVAFRGTAPYEWKDNFLGGAATEAEDGVSTEYQEKALIWYKSLGMEERGYETVTVTGHSKGGNKAKYITLMDGSVDRCVSFDGQGFSDEFIRKYSDEIAKRQYKITNHNVNYDFVNLLLNDVGEIIYYQGHDYGEGTFLEAHCPNTFFIYDENGNAGMVRVSGQAEEMEVLDEFLNSYLRTLTPEDKEKTVALIADIVQEAADQGLDKIPWIKIAGEHGYSFFVNAIADLADYLSLHPRVIEAARNIVERFNVDERAEVALKGLVHYLKYGTSNLKWRGETLFAAWIEGDKGKDMQVVSYYNLLEKNRVFDISKLEELGNKGKTLLDTGYQACEVWEEAVTGLKEAYESIPGDVKSPLLGTELSGVVQPMVKEEYETMGEYVYNTVRKITEDIPKLDKGAAEKLDEITETLGVHITTIKGLEETLGVKKASNTLPGAGDWATCIR